MRCYMDGSWWAHFDSSLKASKYCYCLFILCSCIISNTSRDGGLCNLLGLDGWKSSSSGRGAELFREEILSSFSCDPGDPESLLSCPPLSSRLRYMPTSISQDHSLPLSAFLKDKQLGSTAASDNPLVSRILFSVRTNLYGFILYMHKEKNII